MRAGALARALRQIEAHPEFRGWLDAPESMAEGGCKARFEFGVDMPPGWAAEGASPTGVRTVEPITVEFDDDYPNSQPIFRLRQDFPSDLPHLQPRAAGRDPRPCLVLGSEANLFLRLGVPGMLGQLARWLHAAAHGRLNDDPAGWEPARRDLVEDNLVANLEMLHSLPAANHSWAYRHSSYSTLKVSSGARLHQITLLPDDVKLTAEFWKKLYQVDPVSAFYIGRSVVVILSPKPLQGGEPFVDSQYRPEAVHDLGSLRLAMREWRCEEVFESFFSALNAHIAQLDAKKIRQPLPIAIAVNIRRPRPLLGTSSNIETMAYVLEVRAGNRVKLDASTPVRIAAVVEDVGPALLQRFNQESPSKQTRRWAAMGCGSLGSKIAVMAARHGRAPSVVIDEGFQAPHNYARHQLLPKDGPLSELMAIPKAWGVADQVTRLKQDVDGWVNSIEAILQDSPKLKRLRDEADWLLLNTTAAVHVRNTLSELGESLKLPRLAEGMLLGAGKVAYLSVAGPSHNPNPGELYAEAIYHFGQDADVSNACLSLSAQLESIRTGVGCGSETMPITDAKITQHAASMTSVLMRLHDEDLPGTGGRILIGISAKDGLGSRWETHEVPPFLRVALETIDTQPWTLALSQRAHEMIEAEVRRHPHTETGGVLWGHVNEALGIIYVVDVLEAPADSKRGPNHFDLGVEGLDALQAQRRSLTHGHLHCVGTWHSHLAPSGPSAKDRQVAKTIASKADVPNALLIWTPAGYKGLMAELSSSKGTTEPAA